MDWIIVGLSSAVLIEFALLVVLGVHLWASLIDLGEARADLRSRDEKIKDLRESLDLAGGADPTIDDLGELFRESGGTDRGQ